MNNKIPVGTYPHKLKNIDADKYKFIKVKEDIYEKSVNQYDSDKYLQYAQSSDETAKKVYEIISKLPTKKIIVDTTMGSGKLITSFVNTCKIIGYENNKYRRTQLKKRLGNTVEIYNEFNKKQIKMLKKIKNDNYIVLICDPPWGSWEIMKYKLSILGLGDFKSMGQMVKTAENIVDTFILILQVIICLMK